MGRGWKPPADPAREQQQRIRVLIYGEGVNERILQRMTDATGIPKATLYRWKQQPELIPLGKLTLLMQALKISGEDLAQAIAGEVKK